jgi:phosphoribosylglycinamide formyltransferase-1
MKRIAIFASGTGTNAREIIKHFKHSNTIKICLLVCNKQGAGVLNIADENGIESLILSTKSDFSDQNFAQNLKQNYHIDLIVLAGFLWLVPSNLIEIFTNQIVNIHPALLPNYGGKGMYGNKVHQAVIANSENESGITIHYVNENYDEGTIIAQYKVQLTSVDTPESLAKKIHKLEHEYFSLTIQKILET